MPKANTTRRHAALTLSLGKRVAAAHLRWCDDALEELEPVPRRGRK